MIKYSCELHPHNFKLINPGATFPLPASDTYYWHIANFDTNFDKYKLILAFEQAMQIFQRAIDQIPPVGPYLNLKPTDDISKADFIFNFGKGEHKYQTREGEKNCPFSFDGEGQILAHAWSLHTSKPFGGQIHFDSDERWDKLVGYLLTIQLHEFGHCLDLAHSDHPDALMYRKFNGVKTEFHPDDIEGLTKKLGPIKYLIYSADKPIIKTPPIKKRCWLSKLFK